MVDKFKFTEAKIKALSCPENTSRAIYSDSESRSLSIRVLSSGVKTYFLRRKFKGKSERITLGRSTELSVSKARQLAAKKHLEMDAGINPNDQKRTAATELTLSAFFDIYMDNHVRSHNKRPDDTEGDFKRYLKKPLGNKRLSEITSIRVATLHSKIGREIGKRTANIAHSMLRAIFNRAIEWNYFDVTNPTKGIKRFKEEKRERYLSAPELSRFFIAVGEEPSEMMRDFFLVLLFTGARSGEVRSMKFSNLDIKAKIWRLGRHDTKTDDSRVVVLPTPVIAILARRENALQEGAKYVFKSHGKSGHLQEPKRAWSRILGQAKITDFRIHDLRHTWASWMVAQGVSLPIIQKALGHQSITSTAIYSNTSLELIANEAERTALAMIGSTEN